MRCEHGFLLGYCGDFQCIGLNKVNPPIFNPGVTIKRRSGLQLPQGVAIDFSKFQGLSTDAFAMAESCCGQPMYAYFNSIWSCVTCGAVDKERSNLTEAYKPSSLYGIPPYKPKCDCGAQKTSNPNCHAHWCSAAGK